jgi:hypothetical protein
MKTLLSTSTLDLHPYQDEELELSDEMKVKLEKLMEFFDEYSIDYDKFKLDNIPTLDFGKKDAYPNNRDYFNIPGQHNTQKWLETVKNIYRSEQQGENRVQAIRRATNGWHIMETFDFLNWVKFYESGDHMKYKFAKLWYENDDLGPGYFLQIKQDESVPEKHTSGQDIDFARETAVSDTQKRQTIEKQRNKIIGRLDSAEKLLRSPEGNIFSGKEFQSLLEAIYELKKKIQMINKVSTSTKLYEDMIIREANVLNKRGFYQAANLLASYAQTPAASGESATGTPSGTEVVAPASAGDPAGAGHPGAPGGLPSTGPGMAPGTSASGTVNTPPAIEEFLSGLNNGQYAPKDKQLSEDSLEVEDNLEVNEEELLVTEAQLATPKLEVDEPITTSPAPAPLDPAPVAAPTTPEADPDKPVTKEELEISEEDIERAKHRKLTPNFDTKVNEVFSNITIADVVVKLEDLAKIFKIREVPRQLGIVDMMLDSLGLASFFPSLSEATNKALESNNYISTRLEDILSKLHGAMATKEIDLTGEEPPSNPEVDKIKEKLKQDENKDKARKQMRKQQEMSELENKSKETPEIEIEEDLSVPPAPVAPVTPPPAVKP